MRLTSSAFEHQGEIPHKYTCDGGDVIPPLQISEVPEGARSLVLIMDDPDAPIEGSFVHWVGWNISPDTTEITEGEAPAGVEGSNNFGRIGYGGPCPPSGQHRYVFKLYALNKELDLAEGVEKADVEASIEGSVIDSATLMGLYSREE